MKEADLEFDKIYAVKGDTDDRVLRPARLVEKVPIAAGKKRSRTYVIEHTDNKARYHIDATGIRMPWEEYEKHPEYQRWFRQNTRTKLNAEVQRAWSDWLEMFSEFVSNHPGLTYSASYGVRGVINDATSVREAVEKVLDSTTVSVPLRVIMDLYEIPIPRYDAVSNALEVRQDFEKMIKPTDDTN